MIEVGANLMETVDAMSGQGWTALRGVNPERETRPGQPQSRG